MAITYPLTVPTVGVTSLTWTNTNVSIISRSPFTLQGQVQNYPGQLRTASVSITDMMRDQADEWLGFLDALQGSRGTFLMGDPAGVKAKGVATGVTRVRGAGQTGTTLLYNTNPVVPTTPNWLRRGDWIQLGTGASSRLYKVTQDSGTDASGFGMLEIWPALRTSPGNNATITRNNTVGLFRLSSGSYSYSEDNSCRYTIDFNCEEVI